MPVSPVAIREEEERLDELSRGRDRHGGLSSCGAQGLANVRHEIVEGGRERDGGVRIGELLGDDHRASVGEGRDTG